MSFTGATTLLLRSYGTFGHSYKNYRNVLHGHSLPKYTRRVVVVVGSISNNFHHHHRLPSMTLSSRWMASMSGDQQQQEPLFSRPNKMYGGMKEAVTALMAATMMGGLVVQAYTSTTTTTDDDDDDVIAITPKTTTTMNTQTTGTMMTMCSSKRRSSLLTPSKVGDENFDDMVQEHNTSTLPIYTADDVASNNGDDGKPIWMTYGGHVYDVTDFISNHPGGSEKIMMAAGSALEPFWHIYRQHFASDLPTRLLEHMLVGILAEEDQEKIDQQMEVIYETDKDPFEDEPTRHKQLKVHSDQPMNAEVPEHLLTQNYLTPSPIFFKRHHHPVPYLSQDQIKGYKLEIDLSAYGKGKMKLSLDDLKAMPKVEVVATLQCSGNRRSGFNVFERTSGTTWGQGAVSTAKWGGVRLVDLLKNAGIGDPIEAQEKGKMEHVRFYAADGMSVSVGIEKAMSPYGDVLVCYEMNDEELPRDHGYPLRLIVPGYAGIRNVKWLKKIELSSEEAEGPWQRGLNYKVLPPNIHDANDVDLDEVPSVNELSVTSGITTVEPIEGVGHDPPPGEMVMMKVRGWAFSGGGRNVVRVDVTGDRAKTWVSAVLGEGSYQRYGRAWAWTFWEATVPATVQDDGSVHIYCKAVDMAFNTQPETAKDSWNVRGLLNNSWYKRIIMFNR